MPAASVVFGANWTTVAECRLVADLRHRRLERPLPKTARSDLPIAQVTAAEVLETSRLSLLHQAQISEHRKAAYAGHGALLSVSLFFHALQLVGKQAQRDRALADRAVGDSFAPCRQGGFDHVSPECDYVTQLALSNGKIHINRIA